MTKREKLRNFLKIWDFSRFFQDFLLLAVSKGSLSAFLFFWDFSKNKMGKIAASTRPLKRNALISTFKKAKFFLSRT